MVRGEEGLAPVVEELVHVLVLLPVLLLLPAHHVGVHGHVLGQVLVADLLVRVDAAEVVYSPLPPAPLQSS